MEKIRFGIVGIGMMGRMHATSLQRNPHAEVVAVCARTESKVKAFQEEFGVPYGYTNVDELVNNPEVDAIVVATGADAHKAPCLAACKAKKHIFCEKPLAKTIEDCEEIEKAVAENGSKCFTVGFMRRFDPSYAYAMEKIKAGLIGEPYMVKATGIDPEALVQGAIRFAPTSAGIFIDMAIHDIDLMRWFLGEDPVEVYASGATFKHPEFKAAGDDETGVAMYKCKSGKIGFVHVGRTAPYGYHVETEIVGTEGTLRISPVPEKNLCMIYDKDGAVKECVSGFPERFAEAYLLEMQEFIDCVQTGRKPEVKVYDGTKSTQIAFATTQSYKEGKPVAIAY